MTRARRAALAAAILLLHGGVMMLLAMPSRRITTTPTETSLTWIALPPVKSAAGPSTSRPHMRLAPEGVTLAPFPLPDLAPLSAQGSDPALKDYALCALAQEPPVSREGRERCGKWQRDLAHGIGAPTRPTEREMRLAQKFSHDKAVQDAPILLPCFSPGGSVSVRCLLDSIETGFEMGSYADRHTADR